MGLHTMLCLSCSLSTRRRSFSCASMSLSSVMCSVPDPNDDVIHKGVGTVPDRTE